MVSLVFSFQKVSTHASAARAGIGDTFCADADSPVSASLSCTGLDPALGHSGGHALHFRFHPIILSPLMLSSFPPKKRKKGLLSVLARFDPSFFCGVFFLTFSRGTRVPHRGAPLLDNEEHRKVEGPGWVLLIHVGGVC